MKTIWPKNSAKDCIQISSIIVITNKLVYYGLGELRENKQDSYYGTVSRRWRWSRCGRSKMVGLQSLDHHVLAIFCSFHTKQEHSNCSRTLTSLDPFSWVSAVWIMWKCSAQNLKTVHCANIISFCDKWCILLALFTVPLVNVCGQRYCQLKETSSLFNW